MAASIFFCTRFLVSTSFGEQTFVAFPGSFKKPSATNPTHLASDLARTQISKKKRWNRCCSDVRTSPGARTFQIRFSEPATILFPGFRWRRYTHPPNKKAGRVWESVTLCWQKMNASSGSPCQLPPISWNLFPPHNNNRTSETCLGNMTIRISYSNPETRKPHNEPTIPHNVVTYWLP